jgi:UDP-glucose 4-epimerase
MIAAAFEGKNILITGGVGYLATCLIAMLQDTDCQIIRLDRPGTHFAPVLGESHVQDFEGDVRERKIWEVALANVDFVFHFAAQTSIYVANDNPFADLDINVLPMLYLLETCRQRGWRPMVLFSGTVTEAGLPVRLPVDETHPDNPITVYDLHKWMAENYLKHYVREGVVRGAVLRLANVYGPGPSSSSADRGVLNMMIRKALKGERLTVYGDGRYVRDYVYVEDVAHAFLKAAANIDQVNGKHFVIGSGQRHTIAEAVNLVSDRVALRTGKRVSVVHVEPPHSQSPIEARNFVADTTSFTQATTWQARVKLTEGIDRTMDFFINQTEAPK